MAQLHLLVIVDTDDGSMTVDRVENGPTDEDTVFDDPIWREPNVAEEAILSAAELRLIELINRDELTRGDA